MAEPLQAVVSAGAEAGSLVSQRSGRLKFRYTYRSYSRKKALPGYTAFLLRRWSLQRKSEMQVSCHGGKDVWRVCAHVSSYVIRPLAAGGNGDSARRLLEYSNGTWRRRDMTDRCHGWERPGTAECNVKQSSVR